MPTETLLRTRDLERNATEEDTVNFEVNAFSDVRDLPHTLILS